MRTKIQDAYLAACRGFSEDRVVCDPDLNAGFIADCRDRGLDGPEASLNKALLASRKSGGLSGKRKSSRTRFPNEEEYRFASELAARFLERREGTSLDNILCDPALAREFDELAASISPGYLPVQYRWAALNLRKARQLQPEIVARVVPPIQVRRFRVAETRLDELPNAQGLYLFFDDKELLYIGEASNLRTRLKKHFDHSDNKGLARWMWDRGVDDLVVEVQVLDDATTERIRRALELELIRSRNPLFNIKR